ncbi:ABC transporter substrate-binding protein [Solicola gregarius]|uniref:ABC transporter substrate-binding protein n=1 Tax=Solicola gregarius TaxID=2908642 RepID=A0AA46TFE7_9ACTN|nr:ABC transporter substrate-binding protein [Solicola gregarius]UYM04240.1 ABC transporter substrate-binding protein [Solicola gregarius]
MSTTRNTNRSRLLAAVLGLVLLGTLGCTGGGSTANSQDPVADVPVRDGGEVVIGAEQEPACADWLSTCAGSIWGDWLMRRPTIPVTFDIRKDGDDWVAVPSDLLTGEPEVESTDKGMTITYSINPDAVWSDGEPITSTDFAYTAEQIRDGDNIFDKSGYDTITEVATPDPKTAVVHLDQQYANWRMLFSNTYGVLPAHLLEGKDRTATMRDGYSFSGGPWIIESWKRGTSVTLVPNENYWGDKPHLDKVTFTFIPDTAAAFQALKSGQVDALYPTPQLNAMSQIEAGLPGINSQVDPQSGNLEALWINNDAFPFDSEAVRRAATYSIDRDALVDRIYGAVDVEDPAQSFLSPLVSAYASDSFDQYELDLDEAASLMEEDGWSKGSDGIWEKDGRQASFVIHSLAGNKRRDLMLQILQQQFADAGFDVSIETTTPADLFTKVAPAGDFQMGLWTLVDYFPEPTLDQPFGSANIPTKTNGYSGINFGRVSIDELDPLLDETETELDVDKRIETTKAADKVIADSAASIPIVGIPNILLWNEKVGGTVSINPAEGPFWNLEAWGLAEQ